MTDDQKTETCSMTNGQQTLDGGEIIMAEKSRKLTQEQKALMKEGAARKRAQAKKEMEAALQGKSMKEQKIYKLQLKKEALQKRIAEIKQAEKKLSVLESERKNRIIIALGTAVMVHHKTMEKLDEVLNQFQIVADSLGDTSKKNRNLKADINEGIAIIMKERQMPQADASAGKKVDLDMSSDESKTPEDQPVSPPRRKKAALNQE